MRDVLEGRTALPEIRTLPLANAQDAHDLLQGRRTSGKLVIKPWA